MPQLSYEECLKIQIYLEELLTARAIAIKLDRSNSTISDEIKKYSTHWKYNAKIAWIRRNVVKALVNTMRSRIERWWELEEYILEKIKQYRSPEQIAWRLKREKKEGVGKDTIYKYIKAQHPELIKQYFRRRGKKYKYGTIMAGYIHNRVSIHDRPKAVYRKERYGDWEWDTVWNGIVTYVERKSLYTLAEKTNGKYAENVTNATVHLFNTIPKWLRKTITLDNGREFVEHYMWKWMCGIGWTYFADKGNPWQRGTNENTNWLLRQFFPKKTDFKKVIAKHLENALAFLNNRPRKSLHYKTPTEVLHHYYCADWK